MQLEEFSVGIICPLPIEVAAMRQMLDEHYSTQQIPRDPNLYHLGRIGEHKVVIAGLPEGLPGIASATTVAERLWTSFHGVKALLLVGIGGGAFTTKNDMRLGDVVVSRPDGRYGGVVQYDFGKSLSEGRFEHTRALNSPPQELLATLAALKSNHLLNGDRSPDYLTYLETSQSNPNFKSCGAENDLLFESEYNHTGGRDCSNCDKAREIKRIPRKANGPVIHYGTIASANQLMRDAKKRDLYNKDYDGRILCFEMEAAGLMNSTPCLVIRGISDYADSHKREDHAWHGYAAAAAAAFAKEFIKTIPGSELKSMSTVGEVPWSIRYYPDFRPQTTTSMYKPLTGCEARLLRLKQTTRYEKRVAGDFMIVPLDLDVLPPYTALSYAWGSDERPDTITVSGMAMKVTRNLYSILQTICQTDATGHADSLGLLIGNLTDQHMWIDAVCIDQDNGDEKSKQVRMMADIFGKASKTLMWLGEAYDESNMALDWLIGISKMAKSDFDALSDSEKLDRLFDVKAWNALCKLLQRPYFRRRWIIEEAALSQDPWLVCGKKVLGWEAFEVGFDRCGGVLYNLAYKNGLEVPSTDAEALTGIWILRYRLQQGLDTPLFEMLSRCRRCNTVKRRDRVFALLGICQKAEAQSNKVGYKDGYKDKIEDIFTRQMLSHVKIWKDLNILCVCNEETRIPRPKERYQQPNGEFVNPDDPEWATVTTLPDLPTWVPNWTSPRTWWKLGPQSWWAMSKWEPLFNAAGGTQPTIVNLTEAASRGLLKLKGLHVDTVYDVEKTTPPLHPDQRNPCSNFYINCWILYHKFPLALTPYESETERLDAFWRTITVGGRKIGTNDMFAMDFVRWFCLDFFQDPKADGMFGELLRLRGFYRGEQPPKDKWFVRDDVPPVYWNSDQVAINFDILCEYKFFVTKSGRMGLGPANTVPGDEVCVFHGCSSPLIMYRSASDSTKLCIRGETYIHSFMFGEAVQMVRQGKLREEIFSLL